MAKEYNFKQQIDEDIALYQKKYNYYPNITKPEWAFNFWILYNFFTEDESVIGDKIIDYHDLGVDAFEIYEDTNDLFLIQNKYYSEGNRIDTEYVKNDFLIRAITALENGTYKHCEQLQKYFTKNKSKPDFKVYLQLFITNNTRNEEAELAIKRWNCEHPKYQAQIFYLDDMKNKYFNEELHKNKNWENQIVTVNKGTILNINSNDYKLQNVVDARYVFTPVQSLYEMYKKSIVDKYPIFDENIREYLGNRGVNKAIYSTLLDSNERQNFFYYNNGVTIICDSMTKIETAPISSIMHAAFKIKNPQIVNGCQTVNSIYQALDNIDDREIQDIFKDTFVMVKVLQIDKNDPLQAELYKKIVKYNNSQNSIDEKAFVKNTSIFNRVQRDFKDKGFLVLIKQSDKNAFTEEYGKNSAKSLKFKELSKDVLNHFEISKDTQDKLQLIDLSKLLQVILAFTAGGYEAYTKKPNLLKYGTKEYNKVVDFIQNNTSETLLYLYVLYLKLEEVRSKSSDNRTPIVYYALNIFGKYECENDSSEIIIKLSNKEYIQNFIKCVSGATKMYCKEKQKKNPDLDYNHLIKTEIDYELLKDKYEDAKDMI